MRHVLPLLAIALPSALVALSDELVAQAGDRRPNLEAATAVAKANNAFATELYRGLVKGDDNMFFSPYSISAALAMTRIGAAGRTAEQMDTVLRTAGIEPAGGHRALAQALTPRKVQEGWGKNAKMVPAYQLQIANALWGQTGLWFEEPFLETLDKKFGAPLQLVDFRRTKRVRDMINGWVEEHTAKKIKDIVPPGMPTSDTRLVLSNAIYFKASWTKQFEKQFTKPTPFTMLDGKKIRVPMMHRVDHMRYAATDEVQIVEIPYRGHDTSMVVILPKKKDGLPAAEAKLDANAVSSWLGRLRDTNVQLKLPRFEFTSAYDLAEKLPALGMTDAFDAKRADFTGMTREEPLFIDAVLHKAFIALDESGTEAAAATIVMMAPGAAAQPEEPQLFLADHPFLFFIQHRKTGCILFAGRVTEPEIATGAAEVKKEA